MVNEKYVKLQLTIRLDMEENITARKLKVWKRKRRITYAVFLMMHFVIGLEVSCIVSTLWIYVSTILKPKNEHLFYGLINAAVFLPILLFLPPVARWMDKSRRMRLALLTTNGLSLLGSILYTIPFSPYLTMAGRFLTGFNMFNRSLIVAEVARCYNVGDCIRMIPMLSGFLVLGFVTGPLISMFFMKANFWIGRIHITYGNIVGVELLLTFALMEVLVFCCVFDLSKELDMKKLIRTRSSLKSSSENEERIPWNDVIRKVLRSFDAITTLIMSFCVGMMELSISRSIPLLIVNYLHLSYGKLNIFLILNNVTAFLLLAFIFKVKLGPRIIYYCGVMSMISMLLLLFCFVMVILFQQIQGAILHFMLTLMMVFFSLFLLAEKVYTQITCANLAQSCNQSYFESMRTFTMQVGAILGSMTAAYFIEMFYVYTLPVYASMAIIFFVILIVRRETLKNPKPVI